MRFVNIINQTQPGGIALKLKYCDSYFSRLMGLMFKKSIAPYDGILMNHKFESRINASIHMLFMRFSITVLWLNKDAQVIDKKICMPWRLMYAPSLPAQFIIETSPEAFNRFNVDDQLLLKYV